MFDTKLLLRAGLVGTTLHIVLVLLETVVPALPRFLGLQSLMFAVMMISGVAGLLYARDLDRGFSAGAMGGLAVGLVSAFVGLGLGILLQTMPTFPLGMGSVLGTAIGAIGGLFGQMAANIRKTISKM